MSDLPSRPARVAIVSSGTDSYGVKRSIETLIRAFKDQGVEPILICLEAGEMLEAARRAGGTSIAADVGLPEEYGSVGASMRNLMFSFTKAARLSRTILQSGADRVIIREPRFMPLVAKACWHAGIPGFWLMPNLVSNKYPLKLNAWIYDFILARYGMTAIANSRFTQSSLVNFFSKSHYSHLGINPQEFDPEKTTSADRRQFGLSQDDAVFGIFARLVPFKGQLIFIRALASVLPAYPQARLLICGGPLDSDYGNALQQEINRLSLNGKVILTGASDKMGIPISNLYAMTDVIVNARLDPEPFGLSIIEGMLMGKPLLVHALGGPAETVIDGADGWHMTAPTVEAFVHGLRRAMADREKWHQLGAHARQHALGEFTDMQAARRILAILRISSAQSETSKTETLAPVQS